MRREHDGWAIPGIPVTLIKLKANHSRLRTWSVDGVAPALPEVGACFELVGLALAGAGFRYVNTSPVAIVERLDRSTWKLFTISGSIYLVVVCSARSEIACNAATESEAAEVKDI